jgi:hypothetical protein
MRVKSGWSLQPFLSCCAEAKLPIETTAHTTQNTTTLTLFMIFPSSVFENHLPKQSIKIKSFSNKKPFLA